MWLKDPTGWGPITTLSSGLGKGTIRVNSYCISLLLLKDARGLVDRKTYAKSERMSVVIVFPIDVKRDQMTMTSWYPITAGTPLYISVNVLHLSGQAAGSLCKHSLCGNTSVVCQKRNAPLSQPLR
jgi:hypothetical protein